MCCRSVGNNFFTFFSLVAGCGMASLSVFSLEIGHAAILMFAQMPTHKILFTFAKCRTLLYLLWVGSIFMIKSVSYLLLWRHWFGRADFHDAIGVRRADFCDVTIVWVNYTDAKVCPRADGIDRGFRGLNRGYRFSFVGLDERFEYIVYLDDVL